MNFRKTLMLSVILGISGAIAAPASVAFAKSAPVEDFATRPAMLNVRISPDGKKLAYRVAQTKKGDYAIEVRDVNNLTGKPVRLGSKKMSITGFSWLGDNSLRVRFTQKVGRQVKKQNQGVFRGKQALVSADGKGRFKDLFDDTRVISSLPDDPNHVMVRTTKNNIKTYREAKEKGVSFSELNSGGDYYKMNVNTGSLNKISSAEDKQVVMFDDKGYPRVAFGFDNSSQSTKLYTKSAGGSVWEEIFSIKDTDDETQFSPLGFVKDKANSIYVSANRGADTASIYEFNLATKQFGRKVFSKSGQDITDGFYNPKPSKSEDVAGFYYYDSQGNESAEIIDPDYRAKYQAAKAAFPGKQVSISSMTRDGSMYTVSTASPKQPSMHYLVKDGGLLPIGNAYPALSKDELREQRFITYTARDGRKIPAYVTVPNGAGPHPVIVMPHGGPNVSYRPGAYDEWSQMLASNGYMVLDPLFRGTTGLGNAHHLSGFMNWGEEMSDDMDDGVNHLVNQGLANKDKAAMFGWSFGGYSAFAASIRKPQMYKCVIAGAGVADIEEQNAGFSDNRRARRQLKRSYGGLNPIKHVNEVSVPILVIHGELDQRVRLVQSAQFVDKLEKLGKPHKNIVLKGADHFGATLDYDHRVLMYTEMLNFLKNDCGI